MTMDPGATVRRDATLREQVLATLRKSVLSGAVAPGEKLVEARISTQLGVSRGPVREAIRQLVEEGLLEHVPYKGTVVKGFTVKDIEEIYSFRTLLERFAFKVVWPRRTAAFFQELDRRHTALVEAITRQGAPQAAARDQLIEREMELHSVVYEFADHSLLLSTWLQLRKRIHLYFVIHQTAHDRVGPLPDAHVRYVERAKGDSLDAMLEEIDDHMQRGLDRLRQFVREWNPATAGRHCGGSAKSPQRDARSTVTP